MGEEDRVTGVEIGGDMLLVDLGHFRVGHEHHDHIGLCGCIGDRADTQTGGFSLRDRGRPFTETDAHIDARLLQVEGMSVALRAITQDGDLAIGHSRLVDVGLVVDVRHSGKLSLWVGWSGWRSCGWAGGQETSDGSATRPVR